MEWEINERMLSRLRWMLKRLIIEQPIYNNKLKSWMNIMIQYPPIVKRPKMKMDRVMEIKQGNRKTTMNNKILD